MIRKKPRLVFFNLMQSEIKILSVFIRISLAIL